MRLPGQTVLRRLLLGALLLPSLAACTVITGPDGDLYDEERRLERAWNRWDAVAIRDYDYTLRRSCYCGSEVVGPVRISVRNDVVVSRYYLDTGFPVPSTYARYFPTIDGLFAEIADAIDYGADRLIADYDDGWGYPQVVDIDYRRTVADDEVVLDVWGFVPR